MKKRIAMISVHTCPLAASEGKETGGMNVYVMELSKQLAKGNFIVDIFTRSQDEDQPKIVKVSENLRVIHLKAGPEKYIHKKRVFEFLPEFIDSFKIFQKEEFISYDLLHAHYYLSGMVGLAVKKSMHLPLIVNFHTLALMKNLVARDELEKEEKDRIKAEMQLVFKANKIIVSSENERDYLKYLYNCDDKKISLVTPGVDTSLFKPIAKTEAKRFIGANAKHRIILFVGRIEPLKGIDSLLYALKIMIKKNPSLRVCLWIVGGDISQKSSLWSRELRKIEELRRFFKMTTIVKFIGQKPQNELPYYYNASEIVVMPSHYESYGLSALEAMACGVPLITSNVAGIANLIDDKYQKLITSANNPLLLAEQMENLLTNEKIRQQFSQDILLKVQDLSWERVAAKVAKVYSEGTSFAYSKGTNFIYS